MSHAFADMNQHRDAAAELEALGDRVVATSCEVRAIREIPADVRAWLVLHLALVAQRIHAAADLLEGPAAPASTSGGRTLDLEPFRLVLPPARRAPGAVDRRVA